MLTQTSLANVDIVMDTPGAIYTATFPTPVTLVKGAIYILSWQGRYSYMTVSALSSVGVAFPSPFGAILAPGVFQGQGRYSNSQTDVYPDATDSVNWYGITPTFG